ncbi:hypothetical protein HDK64DRAFT_258392 [Phyllosticta capitalensis]
MELMRLGRTTHGSGRMHYSDDILQRLFAAYLSEGESQQWTERFKRFVLLNYLNVSGLSPKETTCSTRGLGSGFVTWEEGLLFILASDTDDFASLDQIESLSRIVFPYDGVNRSTAKLKSPRRHCGRHQPVVCDSETAKDNDTCQNKALSGQLPDVNTTSQANGTHRSLPNRRVIRHEGHNNLINEAHRFGCQSLLPRLPSKNQHVYSLDPAIQPSFSALFLTQYSKRLRYFRSQGPFKCALTPFWTSPVESHLQVADLLPPKHPRNSTQYRPHPPQVFAATQNSSRSSTSLRQRSHCFTPWISGLLLLSLFAWTKSTMGPAKEESPVGPCCLPDYCRKLICLKAHRVAWRYLVKVPIILKTRELKGPGKDRKEEAAVFALKSAKFSRNNIVLTFPRTPMRPGNLNKRFSDWEDEDCVAAYMNFSDRAAFRSFLLSFPILNAYAVWRQHTDCLPRARQVLTLLVTNEYMFPLFLEEIVDELGRKEDSKTSKLKAKSKESPISREDILLAAILIHLVEYTTPLLDRTSLHHKLEFQASANKTFNDLFGLEIPNSHNISEADVTYWGKRMHTVEDPIETYNACAAQPSPSSGHSRAVEHTMV